MSKNQKVETDELAKIRGLDDFDLIMLISEIHDHGWPQARATLAIMPPADEARFKMLREKAGGK
jgi:hypothetical protein